MLRSTNRVIAFHHLTSIGALLLAGAACGGADPVGDDAASAADSPLSGDDQKLTSQFNGRCLDVFDWNQDNGAKLVTWSCSGLDNQSWSLIGEADGSYRIVSKFSHRCLDVPGGGADDGLAPMMFDCHGGDNQRWFIEDQGDGYQIRNKASGKCLDAYDKGEGGGVQQWSCWGAPQQRWSVGGGATPPSSGAPKLHVSGNQLQDPNGNNVQLHGVHALAHPWFSGEGRFYSDKNDYQGALSYLNRLIDTFTDHNPRYGSDHGWYMNEFRFSTAKLWHGDWKDFGEGGAFDMDRFRTFTDQVIVPMVQHAKEHGMYVVLFPDVSVPEHSTVPELQSTLLQIWDYWSSHPALRSAENVHFELCNEPIYAQADDGSWGSGEQKYSDALVRFLQPVADKIRNNGADNVIWVPGLAWQSYYNGYVNNPVRADNLGYAVHVYPQYGQPMGDDPQRVRDYWRDNVKPIADRAPINITEMLWQRWYPGDNEYWHLFDGQTGDDGWGFGTAIKHAIDGQGNVSWVIHLPQSLLGAGPTAPSADPDGVLNEMHNPERDNSARPAFEWFFQYRFTGPR